MIEKPINFNAAEVRAVLAGRKTQFRRIATIIAVMGNKAAIICPDEKLIELEPGEFRNGVFHYESVSALSGPYRLPFKIADHLWVRETWACGDVGAVYKSDHPKAAPFGGWKSPVVMPRWASRITLIVTDVRVQRLQDISAVDAEAEGVYKVGGGVLRWERYEIASGLSAVSRQEAFALFWDGTNFPGSWDENPWVAAYTFATVLP